MNILSKDILPLKTSQKFSSVLEPYAGKVASTVLRRECHCEVMFLSDKVNTEDEPELTTQYQVRSIPTILFFKDGKIVDQLIGATTKAKLEEKLNAYL